MLRPLFMSLALGAALLGPAATPARAGDTMLIQPVFSQLVTMLAPEGFIEGVEATRRPSYVHELVPKGETVERWTQMISLTGSEGLAQGAPGADAMQFAGALAAGYHRACPDSFAGVKLAAPKVPGAHATFAGWLGCGQAGRPDLSEQMVFLVMVGTEDIYTLQWAARGAPSARRPDFDRALWQGRLDRLAAVAKVCDKVKGEAPPYPSCSGK